MGQRFKGASAVHGKDELFLLRSQTTDRFIGAGPAAVKQELVALHLYGLAGFQDRHHLAQYRIGKPGQIPGFQLRASADLFAGRDRLSQQIPEKAASLSSDRSTKQ
jgi:hypothetical protein